MAEIVEALDEVMLVQDKPSAIIASTKKGKGVSFVEDKDGWHGRAFKKGEEMDRALEELESRSRLAPTLKVKTSEGRSMSGGSASTSTGEASISEYQVGEQVATREAYGAALARLGDVNRWSWGWMATQELDILRKVHESPSGSFLRVLHCGAEHGERGSRSRSDGQDTVRLDVRMFPHTRV